MKAVGTNTAERTSAIPTTGPDSSSIAFERRVLWSQSFFDVPLHAFDHDDRVVHHQPDRQHQPKERKRVDGKTEQRKEHERADERNRHGQQRDQRGAPALQEKKDDKDDQGERDQQSLDDFLDAFRDRASRVQRNGEIHVLGKALFHLRHQLLDAGGGVDGVRAGQLIAGNDGARLAVEAAGDAVVLRAQLDAGDIAHPHSGAVGSFANHDVAEFFRRDQAALRQNGSR